MIQQGTIDEAIRRLVRAYKPLQIYLYGDYAWGKPNEESNLDLLVIVESSEERILKRGYLAFEALLELGIPKNVVVFTKAEFDQCIRENDSTVNEIKTRGKIVYARS